MKKGLCIIMCSDNFFLSLYTVVDFVNRGFSNNVKLLNNEIYDKNSLT